MERLRSVLRNILAARQSGLKGLRASEGRGRRDLMEAKERARELDQEQAEAMAMLPICYYNRGC